ncbi:type II CRISPR RNA-guided endonuclease Cas9 [Pontiella sulfatireligans]|uniref:CRISPR-associated endonuclease Cas9 n=1 Tax=Pontiella sulfatireligans TaxID=2750658 RepID=A0A6C2ULG3_9BACT|nr:type II CRISPR RNA-guided endonuclease Cas9 [Pontiella sulfatireligans]VGO20743.1 CRISPR-associated endonuclease Cas9 [Pontiella sulfatireligans]
MSKRILGLDLGTNSIGWAVIDEVQEKIVDAGVRIFPEGVVSKTIGSGDKEETKNATRRKNRQTRRQFYRKRMRKAKLLEVLIEQGMCPLSLKELDLWRRWDKEKKSQGRKFPASDEFMKWIRLSPYELRARAVAGTVSAHELGRVFYHMIQRRGFLSSRKGEAKDSETLFEKGKPGVLPINTTVSEMAKTGSQSFGQYLNAVVPKTGKPYAKSCDSEGNEIRARGRYATRQMYIEEFEQIWKAQADKLGLDGRTVVYRKVRKLQGGEDSARNQKKAEKLRKKFGADRVCFERKGKHTFLVSTQDMPFKELLAGKIWEEDGRLKFKSNESVLFWQRDLRSQKGTLGNCTFEDGLPVIQLDGTVRRGKDGKPVTYSKKPCPVSHPAFELFRAHQFINNIKYGNGQRLTREQRATVLELMNSKDRDFDFKEVVKKLELFSEQFNYEKDFKVPANSTICKLSKLDKGKEWQSVLEEHLPEIWHCFYTYTDSDMLCEKIARTYGVRLDLGKVDKVRFKDDYSRVSLKAIGNILPFLKKGLFYSTSVILGGVKNAFGRRWDDYLTDETKEKIQADVLEVLKEKNGEGDVIEKIKAYLSDPANRYAFSENAPAFGKLYHHSQDVERRNSNAAKLSPVKDVRNPIVQQALHEMRMVVNALMAKYREDDPNFRFEFIHVEMGRDLKNGKKRRRELSRVIDENKKKNDEAREWLAEYGLRPSRENLQKMLLFMELEKRAGRAQSPYTGKTIPLSNLLGANNTIQIEHIMPYSKSLNDSFGNKTLCESEINGMKGDETPYEFYLRNSDPGLWGASSWDDVARRAFALLPYEKARRFASKEPVDAEKFVVRQLNDTRYIAKKAVEVLSEICRDVHVMPGQLTSELRHLWGLNNVLESSIGADRLLGDLAASDVGDYYLVLDQDGQAISLSKRKNNQPDTDANEILGAGGVEKRKFDAKHLVLKLDAPEEADGKYWARLVLKPNLKLTPKYLERPDEGEDYIVFKGMIRKGKFNHDSIPVVLDAEQDDGSCWVKLFLKSKRPVDAKSNPRTTKKEIKLFGQVKDGVFECYIYKCKTDAPDGKYWLILEPDFDAPQFVRAVNPPPEHADSEIIMQGTVDESGIFVSDIDRDFVAKTDKVPGKYYAVAELFSHTPRFHLMENPVPDIAKGQRVVEGTVWIDKYSAEIKFDPKKNREDQRHHAVDAITIALTKRSYLNALSRFRSKEHPEEYKPVFSAPWEGFENDVKSAVEKILVSYRKDERVVSKGKKGTAVRGQLHKDNVFGEYVNLTDGSKSYHRRKALTALETHKQAEKIVDETIKKLVLDHLRDNCGIDIKSKKGVKIPADAFFKDGKPRLFLPPNPKKNGSPVPIKKVRLEETINNARQWKKGKNQYVNPRNNHHVLVYKDSEGELKEQIVSFWDAVQRTMKKQDVYELPDDADEQVLVLEKNDMVVLGAGDIEFGEISCDPALLSQKLYRVQKLYSGDDGFEYVFRYHLASTLNNKNEEVMIKSFKKFRGVNPIKIGISELGEIARC